MVSEWVVVLIQVAAVCERLMPVGVEGGANRSSNSGTGGLETTKAAAAAAVSDSAGCVFQESVSGSSGTG